MTTTPKPRRRGARAEVPVTRDAVVEAAFKLIEEKGFDNFSMRSLASEMGVFPATLYWHVGDRAELLGLVEERWMSELEIPDPSLPWREWAMELGRRYRRNAHAHPDIARLMSIERARNINSLRIPDAIVGMLAPLGLGGDLVHAFNALMGTAQGFVVIELAHISDPASPSVRRAESEMRSLDPEQFPHLAAHTELLADNALAMRWSDGVAHPLDASFEFTMNIVLDGLEAFLATKRTRRAKQR